MLSQVTRVDVIVPTRNGGALLAEALDALSRSTFTNYQLLVFDDASTEPVEPLARKCVPGVQVIRSDTNVGLAAGCNRAIEAGDSEFVVLLNDDTRVDPDWLAELVACADRYPNSGSIASRIRLMSDPRRLHAAGDFFSTRGMPGNRGAWMLDAGQYDIEEPVFSACGGAALYRRAALDATRTPRGKVFDEALFMYCEDVDLGWRLQVAGWECLYCPTAIVYHHLSATGGGTLASYYVARNSLRILAGSVPRGVLAPHRRSILASLAGRTLRAMRHWREPAARATLRGTLAGVAGAMTKRRRAPHLSDTEIRRLRAMLSAPSPPFRGV